MDASRISLIREKIVHGGNVDDSDWTHIFSFSSKLKGSESLVQYLENLCGSEYWELRLSALGAFANDHIKGRMYLIDNGLSDPQEQVREQAKWVKNTVADDS